MNKIKAVGHKYRYTVEGDTITITNNKKGSVFYTGAVSTIQVLYFSSYKFPSGDFIFIAEGQTKSTHDLFAKETQIDFDELFSHLTEFNPYLNLPLSKAIVYQPKAPNVNIPHGGQMNTSQARRKSKRFLKITLGVASISIAFIAIVGIIASIFDDTAAPDNSIAQIVDEPTSPPEAPTPDTTPEPTPEPPSVVVDSFLGNHPVISDPLNNAETYLALLSLVGEAFDNLTLSEDSYQKMRANADLPELVRYILTYRFNHNAIPDEFQHSFGLFWTDNSAAQYPDVRQSLLQNFELTRQFVPTTKWILTWLGEGAPIGFRFATKDYMFDGVRIYFVYDLDNPNATPEHAETIIGWGNTGLMENMVLTELVNSPGSRVWEHYREFGIIELGGQRRAGLISLDDPALQNPVRSFVAAEADNYRRITNSDLQRLPLNVYQFVDWNGSVIGGVTITRRVNATELLVQIDMSALELGIQTVTSTNSAVIERYVIRR
jgi:hypothetical protein